MTANENCPRMCHLFAKDRETSVKYLNDTGADICVYPRSLLQEPRKKSNYKLSAANGSIIETFGTIIFTLNLGLRRDLTWKFVVAVVSHPIIGADFLAHHGLLIDIKNKRLMDMETQVISQGQIVKGEIQSVKTISGDTVFHKILNKFPDITRPAGIIGECKHQTKHYINTIPGPPVFSKPRRLAPHLFKAAKRELKSWYN